MTVPTQRAQSPRPAPVNGEVERTRDAALQGLDAISLHLDQETDLPTFFGSLSRTAARLVHANRAAFWRLDRQNIMSIQPEPFGFDSLKVLELRVPLRPDGKRIPEQVVFRDGVDRGLLHRKDLTEYKQAIDFLGVRNAAAVSWRAGKMVLGGLAAYDSESEGGFTDEDVWTLRIVARGAALVWQYKQAEVELRRTMSVLERTADSRRRVLRKFIQSTEEARRVLARDLHDEPLQALTAASLSMQRLRKKLSGPKDASLVEMVDEAKDQLASADSRLRRMLFELRPPDLHPRAGLRSAIHDHVAHLEKAMGIDVELALAIPEDLSPPTRYIVYRIVQGALINIEKHSRAHAVKVSLQLEIAGVKGLVEDDGVGFESGAAGAEPGHLGLVSMRELAEMAGGWCQIDSRKGSGTRVEFWVPSEAA